MFVYRDCRDIFSRAFTHSLELDHTSALIRVCFRTQSKTFFKIFKVNLNTQCPLWPDNPMCAMRSCSVFDCPEEQIPEPWKFERSNPVDRTLGHAFQHWSERDNVWIHQDESAASTRAPVASIGRDATSHLIRACMCIFA